MSGYQFSVSSGRRIGISSWGEPSSRRIVVFCHPTPGAGPFDPDPPATNQSQLRFISVDRPGYGGSDPLAAEEQPTVERFADDIAEYLRGTIYSIEDPMAGDFPPISILGWGFGGTVALSFAARHPDMALRVDAIATVKPSRSKRGERYSPVSELRKRGIEGHPGSLQQTLDEEPKPDFESLGLPDDDPALGWWGFQNRLSNVLENSYERGAAGVASDRFAALNLDWTHELENIECSCVLSYGDSDTVAGYRDAKWFERHVPTAQLEVIQQGTHSVIAPAWGLLTSDIRETFEAHATNTV
jgi:pimeloyl-ACP methyl ester carboxylesterase